jgi:hypothetical protein
MYGLSSKTSQTTHLAKALGWWHIYLPMLMMSVRRHFSESATVKWHGRIPSKVSRAFKFNWQCFLSGIPALEKWSTTHVASLLITVFTAPCKLQPNWKLHLTQW